MTLLAEERCPVSESLFGCLYRSSPEGLKALINAIPADARAMLAVYCYRRAHLQALGLEIARMSSEYDLERFGGRMGCDLIVLSRSINPIQHGRQPKLKGSKGITLATGRSWNPAPFEG